MLHLDMPVIVEGKYDIIKLSNITDAIIIKTDGFNIFKNKEKAALIKKLAVDKGVIVLTDSDSAGGIIRSYLKNIIGNDKIYNVFLPEIKGKEKRKTKPSAAGIVGVEGTDDAIIINALKRFVTDSFKEKTEDEIITASFLMEIGLSGCQGSSDLRKKVLAKLELPSSLSGGTLLKVLNTITSKKQLKSITEMIINVG